MQERITKAQQENLLLLACFDERYGPIVRGLVGVEYFEGTYQSIATRVYEYYDQYKKVPGEHTADLFDDVLEGDDERKSKLYSRILLDLHEQQGQVNGEYVVKSAGNFIRQQTLKDGIVRAATRLQSDGDLDAAEGILNEALRCRTEVFDPGLRLTNTAASLAFLDTQDQGFTTGIPELDRRNLGPGRKELHLYIGLPKSGKTWWMVNLGRRSLVERQRVLHITLEMSEARMAQRYYQCLFAMAKRDEAIEIFNFEKDELGRVMGFSDVEVRPKLFMTDPDIRKKLTESVGRFGMRFNNLLIKQFPTGQLKPRELEAYLDMLEMQEGYIPDLLIVDYADLMYINPANYRHELGAVYKQLRGLAVERNIAVATASQSNRSGVGSKKIDSSNVAEDFSKIAIADCVITYNQTDAEKELGLARLFVASGRNDEDKFMVLLSQNYAMGQYVIDSAPMVSKYWELVGEHSDESVIE